MTDSTCAVPGCSKRRSGRTWCKAHYERWRIHGDPLAHIPLRTYLPPEDVFWGRLDKRGPDECWAWTGATTEGGYGQLTVDGHTVRAHRHSWAIHHGPIPPGMDVLHRCDNPPCCNPADLFLGDQLDNMADRDAKDRVRYGSRHPQAKLTEADVPAILQRLAARETQRSIAASYGVNQAAISRISTGHSWRRPRWAEVQSGR